MTLPVPTLSRSARLVLLGLLFTSPLLQAHDAWVQADGKGAAVHYGHGNERQAFAASKLQQVRALDKAGQALPVTQQAADKAVRLQVQGQPALWLLDFDNGFWSKAPDSTEARNLPRTEVPGATSGSHSVKFGKTVLAWSPVVSRPQGQRLEIVPLSAEAPRAGGRLWVQVLWEGQPLAGARLVRDGAPRHEAPVQADAQGKAQVPVVAGQQMLVVGKKVALANDPRADSYSAAANLVFQAR